MPGGKCARGFIHRIKMADATGKLWFEGGVSVAPPLRSPVYTFSNNVVFNVKMPANPAARFA